MKIKLILLSTAFAALAACAQTETQSSDSDAAMDAKTMQAASLDTILDAQSDKAKARYQYRNPKETLEFFGLESGMTVAEILPGGGWYSKIILPAIGDEGTLIGVDYSLAMWPEFGGFADAEFIEKKQTWPADWKTGVAEWSGDSQADLAAFAFGDRDAALDGTADAVLFIRALHNLSRFDEKGGYMTEALADTHALLKPGGVVGVVQHRAPESSDAAWANGNNGYLKQSDVIAKFEAAGFKLDAQSEVNANPKDMPTSEDMVWRLPPTLGTSKDKPELAAKMKAIGESNRMTLRFVKQ